MYTILIRKTHAEKNLRDDKASLLLSTFVDLLSNVGICVNQGYHKLNCKYCLFLQYIYMHFYKKERIAVKVKFKLPQNLGNYYIECVSFKLL